MNIATANVKAAGLSSDISIQQQDFKDFNGHKEKAIIVTNPPYGERISTPNLLETYKMIGERLKHAFKDGEAWVLSSREECLTQIALKPSLKIALFNGSLECEYRKYSIFDGKFKTFREEGGEVKSSAEKRMMEGRRSSWKRGEDKDGQRIKRDDRGERRNDWKARQVDEDADIFNFRFKSLERRQDNKGMRKKSGWGENRNDRREERGKIFGKKNRDFDNDKD